MAEPHFIGWYYEYRVQIYKDDDERPWRIVFDPIPITGVPSVIQPPEERERTADAAKNSAEAVLQKVYCRELKRKVEWTTMRND